MPFQIYQERKADSLQDPLFVKRMFNLFKFYYLEIKARLSFLLYSDTPVTHSGEKENRKTTLQYNL